ncbi:hypothetical protein IFM89_007139, partial [Coptis chinensis]
SCWDNILKFVRMREMLRLCQFLNTIGKQLDESPKSRRVNDAYFNRMKDLTTHPQLAQRLKFMVRDVLNLLPFTNKPTAVNSKLLTQGCGGIIIGRTSLLLQGSGAVAPLLPAEKRPAPVTKINPDELRKKTVSLLKKYFGIHILYEALQCVEELKARTGWYGIPHGCCKLKDAFLVKLDMSPHMVEPIMKLLEYLFTRMVLTGAVTLVLDVYYMGFDGHLRTN